MDSQVNPIVSLVRERLDKHPHFRGRTHLIQIRSNGDSLVLSGRVPTYYLKQLLQEAVKLVPDIGNIDNRVAVQRPRHRLEWRQNFNAAMPSATFGAPSVGTASDSSESR